MQLDPGTETTVSEISPSLLPASVGFSLGWRKLPSQLTWATLAMVGPRSCSIHAQAQGQLGSSRDPGSGVAGPLPPHLHRRLEYPVDHVPRPEGSWEAIGSWGGGQGEAQGCETTEGA